MLIEIGNDRVVPDYIVQNDNEIFAVELSTLENMKNIEFVFK